MKTQEKHNCLVAGLCFGMAVCHIQSGNLFMVCVMITLGIINAIAGFSKE